MTRRRLRAVIGPHLSPLGARVAAAPAPQLRAAATSSFEPKFVIGRIEGEEIICPAAVQPISGILNPANARCWNCGRDSEGHCLCEGCSDQLLSEDEI